MVDGARARIGQRVDQRDPAAGREPAAGELEERRRPVALDVAQPEAGEQGVGRRRLRLGPRVADVEMGAQAVGDEPLAGPVERCRGRVVHRELALRREERRPPAGAGGELDDPAARSAAPSSQRPAASSSAFQAASWIGPCS